MIGTVALVSGCVRCQFFLKADNEMTKRFIKSLLIAAVALAVTSCSKSADDGKVTGKFVDEFGNKFELREDHTATIQFNGQDKVNETRWYDGEHSDTSYVTIGYNGDSTYYYMSHGKLYRRYEDMKSGFTAIELKRQ